VNGKTQTHRNNEYKIVHKGCDRKNIGVTRKYRERECQRKWKFTNLLGEIALH
jgi:hypothetical protein